MILAWASPFIALQPCLRENCECLISVDVDTKVTAKKSGQEEDGCTFMCNMIRQ